MVELAIEIVGGILLTGGVLTVEAVLAKIGQTFKAIASLIYGAMKLPVSLAGKTLSGFMQALHWLYEFLAKGTGEIVRIIDEVFEAFIKIKNKNVDELISEIDELFRKSNIKTGIDGGRLLSVKELKKLKRLLKQLYEVDLKIVDKTYSLKKKLIDWNNRGIVGSFNSKLKIMFLRSEVSELTVFHEMVHLKTWKRLSPEEYAKLSIWEDETIVWDAIWKTKDRWTKRELIDSYEYLNDVIRIPMGQKKLIIEEMEELVKLKKLGILN